MEFNYPSVAILVHEKDFAFGENLSREINQAHRHLRVQLSDFRAAWFPTIDFDFLVILLTNNLQSADDFPDLLQRIDVSKLGSRTIFVLDDAGDVSGIPLGAKVINLPGRSLPTSASVIEGIINEVVSRGPLHRHHIPTYQVVPAMLRKVADVPFTGRTQSLLRRQNIIYVGDLVQLTEAELLRIPDVGRKSLQDVKGNLRELDLRLGMELIDWPPPDFDRFELQFETARRVAVLEQSKGGATFEPVDDHFSMIVESDRGDLDAALQPMTRQMQTALHEKALAFAGLAARLDNQPGWTGIARSAATLADLLDRSAENIPDVLGFLYPITLELGSFVELDQQLSAGADSYAAPLDPEMRRPLIDLVRTLAPWLRSFPSVRSADNEASRFLVQVSELKPAVEVVQSAHDHAILDERDFQLFRQLEAASARGSFQGEKAAGRAKRTASNLVISVAAFAGSFFAGAVSSDYATTSPLVHRIGQFLVQSEFAISVLVADLPTDLKFAITDFVKEMGQHPQFPAPPRPTGPSLPDRTPIDQPHNRRKR